MSALQETLELLEWPRLCEHLASFASTVQGRRHCKIDSLPASLSDSLALQEQTTRSKEALRLWTGRLEREIVARKALEVRTAASASPRSPSSAKLVRESSSPVSYILARMPL